MNDFPLFEDDQQDDTPVIDAEVIALENDALTSIRGLQELARQHQNRDVLILGALAKVARVSGAAAQSLSLKVKPRR